jgi:hypothetical protein
MVTVARVDGKGIWTTISGTDGIFSIPNVAPGDYLVSTQGDGYADITNLTLQVAAGRASRMDISMPGAAAAPTVVASAAPPASAVTPAPATTAVASSATPAAQPANHNWARWIKDELLTGDTKKPAPVKVASLGAPPVGGLDKPADMTGASPAADGQAAPAAPAAPATPPAPSIPEALQANDSPPGVDNFTPFAYGDFTWLNGQSRNKDTILDTKLFTLEARFDTHYMQDFNEPIDHTIVGATESFRSGEVQIEQVSVGGDFHWQNVRGRVLYMDGLFSTTTPRNDGSSATASTGVTGGVGQWDLQNAYKYVSEAWGGYHFNVQHGLNVDAGIFVSYIGLFSYYNFDNWTYQPSYVSSNTPWFFNGVRVQWFPTNKLKIEPWFINGWQSYAKFNSHPGLGGQLLWEPYEWMKMVLNQYGYGEDNLGLRNTQRIHTDDSLLIRYYNNPTSDGISKMAFTFTGDLGCQYGGGVSCIHGPSHPGVIGQSAFLGWMAYDRIWWHKDLLGLTLGGGMMSNPGQYLTLLPPIDGAWAASGTPYFPETIGSKAHMYDGTITLQYMPKQYITWWAETGYRHSDIPYFAGRRGVTPPGGNNGDPQYYTCASGATSGTNNLAAAETACGGGISSVWFPDLRRSESKVSVGVMVKF